MDSKVLINYIKNTYPELREKEFAVSDYGWANYILIVDNRLIFRFPRDEESKRQLVLEQKFLPELNCNLYGLIPNFIYSSKKDDEFTYVGYELIPGKPLVTEEFTKLEENEVEKLAENLAEVLTSIHTFNFERHFKAPVSSEEIKEHWRSFLTEIEEYVFPLLTQNEKVWTNNLFNRFLSEEENFAFTPSLIHGDLGTDHIIYNFEEKRFSGIIDFGDIQIGDPAYDFVGIYISYGAEFTDRVFRHYKGNKDKSFISRIENFYLKRTPFYSIIHGNKTNDIHLQINSLKWLRSMMQ